MTMTEILSKINLTKNKLDNLINEQPIKSRGTAFIAIKKQNDTVVNGVPVDTIAEDIKAKYDSVMALYKNYSKLLRIKNSVNGQVYVNLNGMRMTVAEALAFNTTSMQRVTGAIIEKLQRDYDTSIAAHKDYNMTKFSDSNINAHLSAVLGASSQELEATKKSRPDFIQGLIDKYKETNALVNIDPIDLGCKIGLWETFSDTFYNKLDFRLSEINSRLTVEVDLDKDEDFFRIVNLDEVNALHLDTID